MAMSGQDERAIRQRIETAFARPGWMPTTVDDWRGLIHHADLYDSASWVLALSGGDIVGVCLSHGYPTMGWAR